MFDFMTKLSFYFMKYRKIFAYYFGHFRLFFLNQVRLKWPKAVFSAKNLFIFTYNLDINQRRYIILK